MVALALPVVCDTRLETDWVRFVYDVHFVKSEPGFWLGYWVVWYGDAVATVAYAATGGTGMGRGGNCSIDVAAPL